MTKERNTARTPTSCTSARKVSASNSWVPARRDLEVATIGVRTSKMKRSAAGYVVKSAGTMEITPSSAFASGRKKITNRNKKLQSAYDRIIKQEDIDSARTLQALRAIK
ncbi:hypothetical protein [Pygmaiobacter massiliensis]|uniref:hypothetical protein n=1 Tax=Pygmaiobacter massiliensis TaxID=1917873 RepID=UPI000C7A0294|nr:hypothetical protein [Pygmaiobacter massiliensis]